jgi:hypothetical protein
MGDGDNLNFLKGSRMRWMEERVVLCSVFEFRQDFALDDVIMIRDVAE